MRRALFALFSTFAAATAGATCPALTAQNVFIGFTDASATCSIQQPVCPIGRAVTFSPGAFGYTFSCGPHTFTWSLGDGSSAVVNAPADVTHAFLSPGMYDVTLKVQNPNGSVTVTQRVLAAAVDPIGPVGDPVGPPLTFSAAHVSGLDFAFTPTFPSGVSRSTWDFGDGTSTGSADGVVHHYSVAGTYTVTLRVETNQGVFTYSTDVIALAPRQRAARH